MPVFATNGAKIHYEIRGRGPQTVIFSPPLLWNTRVFDSQARALEDDYRCIVYDHRGQGQSEGPDERAHQIESCYQDALALIEHLCETPCHFVGLSMGGFIGVRVAARHPELVRSLCMLATATSREPREHLPRYRLLTNVARFIGMGAVAPRVMKIMFSDNFLLDATRVEDRARWISELRGNRRSIYRAVNGVIERESCADELGNVRCPVLVVHGTEDRAISRERALASYEAISEARFVSVEGAGHILTVERPQLVGDLLSKFLRGVDASAVE